jgi:PAS domain S-box-containing protein
VAASGELCFPYFVIAIRRWNGPVPEESNPRPREDDARRLQLLVDSVIDYAIYMIDLDGRVASWNSGAARLKGYSAEEIIGQPFAKFFTPEDQAGEFPQHALAVAARTGRFESEGWRVRADGSRFWALGVIDAVRDHDGKLVGFAKVTRDMTERMETQRILRETQERLALSQRMEAVGQLSGGIAHDFNNLLMIIMGNLERIRQETQGLGGNAANLQRSIANALRGAQRAATLTQRLLAFSRRQPLNPTLLDLNRYLPGIADFLQRALGETIEIEVIGAPGLWTIEIDVPQLETSLVNLAVNARDAMPSGGKLTVEASNQTLDQDYRRTNPEVAPGQYALIAVSDTGNGMTPDVLARAFEPFFTTKEIGQGTGLGLSQVYGFVKQSGGHVKIYSEAGHGTTMKLYFPRARGQADVVEDDPGASQRSIEGESILLVEDDNDLRWYLIEALRDLNYRAIGVPNADAALVILERPSTRIDLMLTDVVMPGMSGRELSGRARELRPGLKVLFMSGYSRNAVVHHGRVDLGALLIQKPVSLQDLAARIRGTLDRID